MTCVYENGKYLGSIIDHSVILCDEIMNAELSVSTNFVSKNVIYKMDCYILHMLLLLIILLFIIAIVCYHYAKHRSKRKNVLPH